MKAGTAQKVVLNLLSTATMLRLGLVYRGLMVNMRVSNDKLAIRARIMVARIAEVDEATAASALRATSNDIKRAVLVARGAAPEAATAMLARAKGNLRAALADPGAGVHEPQG
jgi:N-acetylmuramic acid 6-phosphate etherase